MTKLEELTAAYEAAAAKATKATYAASAATDAAEAAVAAEAAAEAVADDCWEAADEVWVAYKAELKKTQEDN